MRINKLTPSVAILHRVAGEGNFNIYRQLSEGRRLFLFAKCLLVTWSFMQGRGDYATEKTIALVKGSNQARYQKQVKEQLEHEFGKVEVFLTAPIKGVEFNKLLPRFEVLAGAQQILYLLCMLFTGSRRFLNLYLLSFYAAMDEVVNIGLKNVENFVCFNDQPFDVAALVYALNNRKSIRTVVIQHGLILSEKFYFPVVAKEFWGWGELSKKHYRSWDSSGKILVKGRYKEDERIKSSGVNAGNKVPVKILIAPSHYHSEIADIVEKVDNLIGMYCGNKVLLGIKLHPSTKFKLLIKAIHFSRGLKLIREVDDMEMLADKYDVLVTKNSTSAVDFMLRGKIVFSISPSCDGRFPSVEYVELIDILPAYIDGGINRLKKESGRSNFLREAISV